MIWGMMLGIKVLFLVAALSEVAFTDKIGSSNESSEENEISAEGLILNRRIIGGSAATPNQFPFVARLTVYLSYSDWNSFTCSGTVLSDRHILTAAHCVTSKRGKAVKVYASIVGLQGQSTPLFSSKDIYVHPRFKGRFNDDIAILKHNSAILRNYGTPPLLPKSDIVDDLFTNPAAIVAGWGKTSDFSAVSSSLQYAQVNLIRNDQCQLFYRSIVTTSIICTFDQHKGICGGDSGGPLLVKRGESYYLIGVNAFKTSQCEAYSPSGYTYVFPYLDWISKVY